MSTDRREIARQRSKQEKLDAFYRKGAPTPQKEAAFRLDVEAARCRSQRNADPLRQRAATSRQSMPKRTQIVSISRRSEHSQGDVPEEEEILRMCCAVLCLGRTNTSLGRGIQKYVIRSPARIASSGLRSRLRKLESRRFLSVSQAWREASRGDRPARNGMIQR